MFLRLLYFVLIFVLVFITGITNSLLCHKILYCLSCCRQTWLTLWKLQHVVLWFKAIVPSIFLKVSLDSFLKSFVSWLFAYWNWNLWSKLALYLRWQKLSLVCLSCQIVHTCKTFLENAASFYESINMHISSIPKENPE